MSTTKQIPPSQWHDYFEHLTRHVLEDRVPRAVTIEMLSPSLGDQVAASGAHLRGISYDPHKQLLTLLLEEQVDHFAYPADIWVQEQDGDYLVTLDVDCGDGSREIIYLRRSGPPARLQDVALLPFMPFT